MVNGAVIVYKEKGMTSFDVIYRLRKIFGVRKIGHTGTLDPDAEGVLICCLGRATKAVSLLEADTKTYEAHMHLGLVTDTQDISGEVLERREVHVGETAVRETLAAFEGTVDQIPPMYSALKVNGQKLVDLARRGKEVERQPRKVTFSGMEILSIDMPEVVFRVTCTRGAYIRTLCHDAGLKLGCGAAMGYLLRTRVGDFGLDRALKLDEIRIRVENGDLGFVIPTDELFPQYVKVKAERKGQNKALLNGNLLRIADTGVPVGKTVRMYTRDGDFAGLYRLADDEGRFELIKYFYDINRN